MQEINGFMPQENDGECGVHSIHHALLVLGFSLKRADVIKATGVPRSKIIGRGLSEDKIMEALRRTGYLPEVVWTKTEQEARAGFDELLQRGIPVIAWGYSEDEDGDVEYDHWFVLVGRHGDKYLTIDSNEDDLIGAWSWKDLHEWMCPDPDEAADDDPPYYGIGVVPNAPAALAHSLVPRMSEAWKLIADVDRREWWGYYLEDLLDVFDCPTSGPAVTAAEFFERHGTTLVEAVEIHDADSDATQLRWELGNYQKIAGAHRLTMSPAAEFRAVARLAAALAVISTRY